MNALWNDKLKSWFWKKGPQLIVIVLFINVFILCISGAGQVLALLTGQMNMSYGELNRHTPYLFSMGWYYTPPSQPSWWFLVYSFVSCTAAWLFSTRVKWSNKTVFRRMICIIFSLGTFVLILNTFSVGYMKPISYDLLLRLHYNADEKYISHLNIGSLKMLGVFIMLIPTIYIVFVCAKVIGMYREDEVLREAFENYEFRIGFLGRFGDQSTEVMPDLLLARDAELKTPLVLQGESRQLGTLLIGPPGSGKTSLKISKAFQQDMKHLQKSINLYPHLVRKHGYMTPEFMREWGKLLIGSIIIEPAKDLCDTAFKIALEHGIPKEFIVYLDPSNPNTPGFNCMVGPIEQVAETITAVMDGMSEVSNEFFRQACRTVLKQYIYLLKIYYKDDCTLLDLDNMYQDPRFVKDMVDEVRNKVPDEEKIAAMHLDKRIYWTLVKRTVRWFDTDGLGEERDRQTQMLMRFDSGPHKGKVKIIDKQAEFTRQTRNLLSDLITNPYLARILIGDNEVDLDRIMAKGGILLCNTDNGLLGDVSNSFGKMVLMSVQNAVFRRKGNEDTRPLVSLYVDEFYDYMNSPFLKLAGQGRKYKIAPLVACQSLSQFSIKFDDSFVDGMMGTIRNYIVYGGVAQYDCDKLIPIFGTHTIEELTVRESMSPSRMNSPSYSIAESVTRKEMELVSADDIMFNKFKFSYIRMVKDKSTLRAIKAEGDFVDFGKKEKWRSGLKSNAVNDFMDMWLQNDLEITSSFDMNWIDENSDQSMEELALTIEKQLDQLSQMREDAVKLNQNSFYALEKSNVKETDEDVQQEVVQEKPKPRASGLAFPKAFKISVENQMEDDAATQLGAAQPASSNSQGMMGFAQLMKAYGSNSEPHASAATSIPDSSNSTSFIVVGENSDVPVLTEAEISEFLADSEQVMIDRLECIPLPDEEIPLPEEPSEGYNYDLPQNIDEYNPTPVTKAVQKEHPESILPERDMTQGNVKNGTINDTPVKKQEHTSQAKINEFEKVAINEKANAFLNRLFEDRSKGK